MGNDPVTLGDCGTFFRRNMWGWGQTWGLTVEFTGLNYVYIIYSKWPETWGEHPKNALFMQKMMISTVLFIHFWELTSISKCVLKHMLPHFFH